jgi:zinc transporter ZupT
MPLYYGTGSRIKAVGLGTASGFAEPFGALLASLTPNPGPNPNPNPIPLTLTLTLGALLASLIANEDSSQAVFGGMFGVTAGAMSHVQP